MQHYMGVIFCNEHRYALVCPVPAREQVEAERRQAHHQYRDPEAAHLPHHRHVPGGSAAAVEERDIAGFPPRGRVRPGGRVHAAPAPAGSLRVLAS